MPQEFGNVTQSVPRCPRYEAAFYRLYNGRRIKTRQAQALSLLLRLKKNIAVKLFFDLFPIILFFGAFKFGESDPQTAADILTLITGGTGPEHAPVMLATLVAIVSTFVQIAIVFARGKKPEPMLWISLAVIVRFAHHLAAKRNVHQVEAEHSLLDLRRHSSFCSVHRAQLHPKTALECRNQNAGYCLEHTSKGMDCLFRDRRRHQPRCGLHLFDRHMGQL